MNRPAFQFYPGDWQRDPALRSCSVPARGLWIEMICIMHQAEPYGHLRVNGRPIAPTTLARMVGATPKEVDGWIVELEDAGVFEREPDSGIVSRRMVRDEQTRRARAEGGKLGGNPNLKSNHTNGSEVGVEVANKVNLPPNLSLTPSSSSSSSSAKERESTRKRAPPTKTPVPENFAVSDAVREWARRKGFGNLDQHLESFLAKCRAKGYTYSDWDSAFMEAIRTDWAGLREGRGFPAPPEHKPWAGAL